MKIKKIISVLLCAVIVTAAFAGCSKQASLVANSAIDDKTLLIAYFEDDSAPFFSVKADNKYEGLEATIIAKIFNNIKGDCKTYTYVKVPQNYRLGEDTAYTDKDGKNYVAYMAVGGVQKNVDANNEDYSFTESIISNKIITVTGKNSKVTSYSTFKDAKVGTVSQVAADTFAKTTAISSVCKSVTAYKTADAAFSDLNSGKIDAVVIDEFTYCPLKETGYTVLDGQLDKIEYGFATAKYDRLKDDINEAVYELKDPEYNDKDEFTPIVEECFGYNASSFSFTPVQN